MKWQSGEGAVPANAGSVEFTESALSPRFEILQVVLAYGFDAVWLDLDVYLIRDPTEHLRAALQDHDVLAPDHVDATCLSSGVCLRCG